MNCDLQLHLSAPWIVEQETYADESGFDVSHLQAVLGAGEDKPLEAMVDIYVGDMPEGESAEDQAFANYAEVVGFDEDDPEDFNPISKTEFNGKTAWCFSALCEDDSPMICISQEVKKGILAIICIAAPSDEKLEETRKLIERSLRIRLV